MTTPLLSTKYNIPPLAGGQVGRPHLIDRLNAGLLPEKRLSLVCAPAGYGKTSLVRAWLDQLTNPTGAPAEELPSVHIAWLALDENDNDLAGFLAYLAAALSQKHPEMGNGMLAALKTPRPPSPQILATWLINDLAVLEKTAVLVLDDLHCIHEQSVHDFLDFLVQHQPHHFSLVILSRADPAFSIASLRARGQLVEIRQKDLVFTTSEADQFFNTQMGLLLTSAQLDTLVQRTEGWVSGLQLAGHSLRNLEKTSDFIDSFSGSHAHIADYLANEVLDRLPEEPQSFLLQTAILERLSGPLCTALTGIANAQAMLIKLRHDNLFLVPLDYEGRWFRYHALFADLLRKRLAQEHPDQVPELHQRASRWFEENGFLSLAVDHALRSKHTSRLGAMLQRSAEPLLKQGQTSTLLRWLDGMGVDNLNEYPYLAILYGVVLVICGRPPEKAISLLERMHSAGQTEAVQGEYAMLRGLLAVMRGDAAAGVRLAEEAIRKLPQKREYFRTLAADSLGMAYTLQGDTTAAAQAFERVIQVSHETGNIMMALMALSNLAGLHILQGRLRSAEAAYKDILLQSEDHFGKNAPVAGKALMGLGMLAREYDRLDEAFQYYQAAIPLLEQSVEIGLPLIYLSIAMVQANQKNWDAAFKNIEKARHFSRQSTLTPLDDRMTDETQARLWIMQGKLQAAEDWAKKHGFPDQAAWKAMDDERRQMTLLSNQGAYLVLARLHLGKQQPGLALAILDPLLNIFKQKGYNRRVIEILILQALAAGLEQDWNNASLRLDRALSLAGSEGYRRTFLDEGKAMMELLYKTAARGTRAEYAGQLLAALSSELDSAGEALPREPQALIDPLSDRELEVLVLIEAGLTNQEIAARLHISLSTVKSHTSHIYGKLNINSRTQAVAVARSLNILSKNIGPNV